VPRPPRPNKKPPCCPRVARRLFILCATLLTFGEQAPCPILCATLLTREPVRLTGIPEITDVKKILEIFRMLGSRVEVDFETRVLEVHHADTQFDERLHRLPEEMRSSIMLVPGLLARFGVARIEDDVKGCSLGMREIDPHVEVMQRFGASVERTEDALVMRSPRPLQASQHWLDYASVTTTENFVLCAALARGRSVLMNAASEPHVQEFCSFMQRLGARIEGVGTSRLVVDGVEALGGCSFTFAEDFHEIVTFLALGAITGGDIAVKNSTPEQFPLIDRTFAKFGVQVVHEAGWSHARVDGPLKVREPFTRNILQKVEAAPWPYLPVDLLPIFVALGVRAEGSHDVLEQGLRRRHGLDRGAVQVRRPRGDVRPASRHHLRRQAARAGRRRQPLHHPRGDRAADAGGQHSGLFDDTQCGADPARPPSLRGKHQRPGRAGAVARGAVAACCRAWHARAWLLRERESRR
jgi:UDP-N-acetylglucosamine 1-carboxyvinyltransferase